MKTPEQHLEGIQEKQKQLEEAQNNGGWVKCLLNFKFSHILAFLTKFSVYKRTVK